MLTVLRPLIPAIVIATLPVAALAQSGTVTGTAGGCITGAIIGGPVGAAIGCVFGAAIGTAIAPAPVPVVTYVTAQPAPTAVTLQGNLVVGATVPEVVVLTPIPTTVYAPPTTGVVYAYAFINDKKVIVDTKTRAIVAIVG